MDTSSERLLDEASREVDELHQLLLTGLGPDIGLVQTFRDRLKHISAQGDGRRAVKAACDEAESLAQPSFAAPSDSTRVDELEIAVLVLAVELANANANPQPPDVAHPAP